MKHKMKKNIKESITRNIDLRGEVCPYTFVKSKLIIEEINPGEILEVIVDYAPALKNVPKSMEMEGHEVLDVEQIKDGEWKILLKKKQEGSKQTNL